MCKEKSYNMHRGWREDGLYDERVGVFILGEADGEDFWLGALANGPTKQNNKEGRQLET